MQKILTLEGDTLELIAWREYGRVFGAIEMLVKLNPTLLYLEPFPPGIEVALDDKKTQLVTKVRKFGD